MRLLASTIVILSLVAGCAEKAEELPACGEWWCVTSSYRCTYDGNVAAVCGPSPYTDDDDIECVVTDCSVLCASVPGPEMVSMGCINDGDHDGDGYNEMTCICDYPIR